MKELLANLLMNLGFEKYAKKLYDNSVPMRKAKNRFFNSSVLKWILIFGVIIFFMDQCFKNNAKESALRNDPNNIERHFSQYDGSYTKFKNYIKENLKDPSSFEHVETVFTNNNDGTATVIMKYRGRNSFGAITTEIVKCTLNIATGDFSGVIFE